MPKIIGLNRYSHLLTLYEVYGHESFYNNGVVPGGALRQLREVKAIAPVGYGKGGVKEWKITERGHQVLMQRGFRNYVTA